MNLLSPEDRKKIMNINEEMFKKSPLFFNENAVNTNYYFRPHHIFNVVEDGKDKYGYFDCPSDSLKPLSDLFTILKNERDFRYFFVTLNRIASFLPTYNVNDTAILQCDRGRRRSIHDLYLLYKYYWCGGEPMTYSMFMIEATNLLYKHQLYFHCPDIYNIVYTLSPIHYLTPTRHPADIVDCFDVSVEKYFEYELGAPVEYFPMLDRDDDYYEENDYEDEDED